MFMSNSYNKWNNTKSWWNQFVLILNKGSITCGDLVENCSCVSKVLVIGCKNHWPLSAGCNLYCWSGVRSSRSFRGRRSAAQSKICLPLAHPFGYRRFCIGKTNSSKVWKSYINLKLGRCCLACCREHRLVGSCSGVKALKETVPEIMNRVHFKVPTSRINITISR